MWTNPRLSQDFPRARLSSRQNAKSFHSTGNICNQAPSDPRESIEKFPTFIDQWAIPSTCRHRAITSRYVATVGRANKLQRSHPYMTEFWRMSWVLRSNEFSFSFQEKTWSSPNRRQKKGVTPLSFWLSERENLFLILSLSNMRNW